MTYSLFVLMNLVYRFRFYAYPAPKNDAETGNVYKEHENAFQHNLPL